MAFIDAPTNFFIGGKYDPSTDEVAIDDAVYYDSRDLTTHGLVLGMTGSGKTGLCVCLLEEAILDGIPAIIVDPKGDIGNLLLTFPELLASDFEPWIDPDEARRKGKDIATHATEKAELWRGGLEKWGITSERLQKLKDAAEYTIYTPGSTAGVPVSILASLKAPKQDFDTHAESLREEINGIVTAILSLAGISAEPVKDAEHVFLSNIFEHNWRQGKDLSMEDIILQVQEPPFDKLGVMPVNQLYPDKERMSLAMALNNVIAAPSFQAWLEGVPMDMQSLLYTPEGKPRVSIFYTAHLDDTERMFVMTLVLETLLAWLRTQSGTSSLRALLYIDEIFGYFPPVANPPSKDPLLRLLKQARAFGLGVLMATQNPVDLDYKGLSNIGTWWIGRLQSERDRARVMSGLQEAATSGDMDLAAVEQLVAQVKSRIFLMRNVHDKGATTLFSSRWAMNYLAGPLTRTQISTLMEGRDAAKLIEPTQKVVASTPVVVATASEISEQGLPSGFEDSKPVVSNVDEFFLPIKVSASAAIQKWEEDTRSRADNSDDAQLAYIPVLLAQANVLYDDRKSDIRVERTYAFHIEDLDSSGFVTWKEYQVEPADRRDIDTKSRGEALYSDVPTSLIDSSRLKALKDDLEDVIYKDFSVMLPYNETLEAYGHPDDDPGVFEAKLVQLAREQRDAEVDKVTADYDKKYDRLEEQRDRKQRELQKDEARAATKNQNSLINIGEGLFNLVTGKRTSSSISKIGRAVSSRGAANAEVEETKEEIIAIEREMEDLKQELEMALQDVRAKWDEVAQQKGEYEVTPYKKNIALDIFGVGWVPYWYFKSEGQGKFVSAYE